jgi:hypothetical protein
MARTALTVQQIVRTGSGKAVTYATPGTQHSIPSNDGRVFIRAVNTGTTHTLTVQTPGSVAGLAIAEATFTLTATTGDQMIGPFEPAVFNQSDGAVYIDIDAITGLTMAVYRL